METDRPAVQGGRRNSGKSGILVTKSPADCCIPVGGAHEPSARLLGLERKIRAVARNIFREVMFGNVRAAHAGSGIMIGRIFLIILQELSVSRVRHIRWSTVTFVYFHHLELDWLIIFLLSGSTEKAQAAPCPCTRVYITP